MGELFLQRIQLIFGHLFVTFCCYDAAQDIECGFRLRIISKILLFQELQKVVVLLIRKRKSTGTSNGAMMILVVGAIVAQGIARRKIGEERGQGVGYGYNIGRDTSPIANRTSVGSMENFRKRVGQVLRLSVFIAIRLNATP